MENLANPLLRLHRFNINKNRLERDGKQQGTINRCCYFIWNWETLLNKIPTILEVTMRWFKLSMLILSVLLSSLRVIVTTAFVVTNKHSPSISSTRCFEQLYVPGLWNGGNQFGKGDFKFYRSFDSFTRTFTEEDRQEFKDVLTIPTGMYEVSMTRSAPLGIIFEEIEAGEGCFVQDIVEGGMADVQGRIKIGDILVGVTAIKVVGAKFERRMIPARTFNFDTVVGAISSNEQKWSCNDVVLMFERPEESNRDDVNTFMEFFQPPWDNPWRL